MGGEKSTCVVCREEISKGALKCTHCDSYQDWRRYFGVSTTALSLLIALISVATTFYQVVKFAAPKRSEIRALEVRKERDYLQLAVTNTGNAVAIIRGGSLRVNRDNKIEDPRYELRFYATDTRSIDPFVEPDKAKRVDLQPFYTGATKELPRKMSSDKSCSYLVDLDFDGFDGKAHQYSFQTRSCLE